MVANLNKKCIVIVHLLRKGAEMSRKEICQKLRKEFFDVTEISRTTFYRYISYIEASFPCRVIYDKKRNKYRLQLESTYEPESNQILDYLMNVYNAEAAMPLLLKYHTKIHNIGITTGTDNLPIILKAIDEHRGYSCEYQSFNNDTIKHRTFIPLFITTWEGRWYVIADVLSHPDGTPYTYALERMSNIELTEEIMEPYSSITIEEYFKDSYGIQHNNHDEKPKDIFIKIKGSQVGYIKTRPIHRSQVIIEEGSGYMIIKLHLIPCYNFYQRLLGMRETIEVLEPTEVVKEMKQIITVLYNLYTDKEVLTNKIIKNNNEKTKNRYIIKK